MQIVFQSPINNDISEINAIRNDDRMRSVVRRTKGDRIETFCLLSSRCVGAAPVIGEVSETHDES
jgi:hypothetical protein